MNLFRRKESPAKKGPSLGPSAGAPSPMVYRERSANNFQEEELDCHDRLLVNSAIIQGMVVPVLSKRRTNGDPFIVAA